MAEGMTARAESELLIDNAFLEANANDASVVINVVERTPVEAFIQAHRTVAATGSSGNFHPKGIHIDNDSSDSEATFGYLNRALYAQQRRQNCRQRYACGITHPEAIQYIYPKGTTARGIHIKY